MQQIKKFIFSLIIISLTQPLCAQDGPATIQSRILILLDESSSMIKPWANGQPKYKVADELILRLMDSVYAVNRDVEFSLRVFGHQSTVEENNCYDTKNEVPFAKYNETQMALRLSAIRPLGVTPIAFSLVQAADQDLVQPDRNAYSIILITDGGESCGGDICAVMKSLIAKKVYFRPYIIGLEDDATLKMIYSCMGDYLQVTHEDDISRALKTIVTAYHPLLSITKAEYKELQAAPPAPIRTTETAPVIKTAAAKKEKLPAIAPVSFKPFATGVTIGGQSFSARPAPVLPPLVKEEAPAPAQPALRLQMGPIPTTVIRPAFINVPKLADATPLSLVATLPLPPIIRDTFSSVGTGPVMALAELPNPDFKLAVVDARVTSLELYFVNAKGKLYMSRPTVVLVDHATGKVERTFKRIVDALGNIDVQTMIQPGYYDIMFPTKKGLVMHNVYFGPRKKNKVTVKVKDTKLTFAYSDAPTRPVAEFKAVVTRLNAPPGQDRVQSQKCNEMIEYEPGAYQVEINTLPKDTRIIDVDFNEDTVLKILQPGYGVFSSVPLDKHFVKLFYEKQGKYYFFYTLDVNDPESQHLHLQPGAYQVHYEKGRKGTTAPDLVVSFTIIANIDTKVDMP
jgi:hypothetical protein